MESNLTENQDARLAADLFALAHPVRLAIVRHLAEADACCNKDVVNRVGLAQSTVSQHLKILVDAGLVLVDNSVGEDPPPVIRFNIIAALRKDRAGTVRDFVRSMYKTPQTDAYLDELVRTALRTPLGPAIELLSYPVPREYWRDAIYATRKPVLYAVTPRFAGQAENLRKKHTSAQVEVFSGAGHALFVDEPARFNQLMDEFLMRRVWQ